jgi:hypothetical protein
MENRFFSSSLNFLERNQRWIYFSKYIYDGHVNRVLFKKRKKMLLIQSVISIIFFITNEEKNGGQ